MLKKLFQFKNDSAFVAKNVKIIAFILAGLGLTGELLAIFDFRQGISNPVFIVCSYINQINLSVFNSDLFRYHNFDTGLSLNYLNTILYVLMLFGAIIFETSSGKETRLIRFSMSVVFIFHALSFIFGLISPLFYIGQLSFMSFWWVYWILGRIVNLVFLYLTWYVLFNLSKDRGPEIEQTEKISVAFKNINDSNNWQRFFHFILDTYLCVFIFSGFTRILNFGFLGIIEEMAGERATIYVFLLITRFLYYPFFEIILGTTPAKLLTESRVVGIDGKKPKPGTIFIRTLSRYIPFEPFSFFGEQGWHDNFSKTKVVQEKRIGVNGRFYWLIVPSFVLIAGLIYWGHEAYEDYLSHQYTVNEYKQKIATIEMRLANLDTTAIIQIKDIDNSYSSAETFLKIEKVSNDSVIATIVSMKDFFSESLLPVGEEYENNKDSLPLISIDRAALNKAYTFDYDEHKSGSKNYFELLPGGSRYEIERIERIYYPCIESGGYGSYGDELTISFKNSGWSAKVIEIQPIEGRVKWVNDLPIDVPVSKTSWQTEFNIHGKEYARGEEYKFNMVLKDSLNHTQIYLVEGRNADKTVKLVKEK
jgi:hypothetical protein